MYDYGHYSHAQFPKRTFFSYKIIEMGYDENTSFLIRQISSKVWKKVNKIVAHLIVSFKRKHMYVTLVLIIGSKYC